MKHVFYIFAALILFSTPAWAYKQIVPESLEQMPRQKVDVMLIDNAQEITIRYNNYKTRAVLYGIFCHEYTRSYTEKSSSGALYTRRYTRSVKKTRVPTEFLRKIVKENEGNLYFQPKGMGRYGWLVGELFVGDESVNLHMVEKGYCTRLGGNDFHN